METTTAADTIEALDSLSPYEVAVLVFTSPASVAEGAKDSAIVTLTCKEAYLWAGAIAHAVIRNPGMDRSAISAWVTSAIESELVSRLRYGSVGPTDFRFARIESYGHVVDHFLRNAGIWDERESVYKHTDDAVQSLIWRGHIEDPFAKRVRNILIGVVMTFPVSFTSTGPNDARLDALTWSYVQHSEHGQQQRQIRVKVKEMSEFVLERLIPETASLVGKLSGTMAEPEMSNRDVQSALAKRGYYKGEIDGVIGYRTIQALRQYQQENFLDVTGYPDPVTKRHLRAE